MWLSSPSSGPLGFHGSFVGTECRQCFGAGRGRVLGTLCMIHHQHHWCGALRQHLGHFGREHQHIPGSYFSFGSRSFDFVVVCAHVNSYVAVWTLIMQSCRTRVDPSLPCCCLVSGCKNAGSNLVTRESQNTMLLVVCFGARNPQSTTVLSSTALASAMKTIKNLMARWLHDLMI